MKIFTETKFKDERKIAYTVIEKIKQAAAVLESNDPTHKNGVKFFISKKEYNKILDTEFEKRCARHMNRELIKSFINTKLKKVV
jgi:hypothetical protein